MFYSYSILNPTFATPLSSPLKLQNFKTPNKSLMSVCVQIWHLLHLYVIEGIESNLISACLINDYSLIAQLHILVYERAYELSSISLECTKVKLSILNNLYKRANYDKKI